MKTSPFLKASLTTSSMLLSGALLFAQTAPVKPVTAKAKDSQPAVRQDQFGHPSGKQADTVEYKDPEDMTTRYRPENNKTTIATPATNSALAPDAKGIGSTEGSNQAAQKKHLAGVKYSDVSVQDATLDPKQSDDKQTTKTHSTSTKQ